MAPQLARVCATVLQTLRGLIVSFRVPTNAYESISAAFHQRDD